VLFVSSGRALEAKRTLWACDGRHKGADLLFCPLPWRGAFRLLGSAAVAGPLVLAHRGARQVAPENTVEAFARALAMGADGVELDVHRTADAGLAVHHDADAAGVGVLAEHTIEQIRAARPEVPTLHEALDACRGTLVNVEIKNLPGDADFDPDERAAELVVQALADRGRADDVLVSSFNLGTVDRVRELDATIPTAFLTMLGLDPLEALDLCVARGHVAFHPFVGLLAGDAARATAVRAHELGLRVNAWTVNDPDEMRRLIDAGVDGIVTDVPDVAVELLRAP
jgi:glycerophosphoryl diester phosphodiesterase